MNDATPGELGHPLTLPSEHGTLHATLNLLPGSPGLAVLAHAGLALDGRDGALAAALRRSGLSTLSIDLIARQEEHFADIHSNVPLLCKRLLEFLGHLQHRMLLGDIAAQPFCLYAEHFTTPVAVRVAALRDHDVAALVCRDGLIDLAGLLYLRTLASPFRMLADEGDLEAIARTRRALQEVRCRKELRLVPEIGPDFAVSPGFATLCQTTAAWFVDALAKARGNSA